MKYFWEIQYPRHPDSSIRIYKKLFYHCNLNPGTLWNIALEGTATQTDTFEVERGQSPAIALVASRAIDGVTSGR